MNFQVSDKVVCVDDDFNVTGEEFWTRPNGKPKKDTVYVVSRVVYLKCIFEGARHENLPMLVIVGLPSICSWTNKDDGFVARRFRKLDEIKEKNRLKQLQSQPITQ